MHAHGQSFVAADLNVSVPGSVSVSGRAIACVHACVRLTYDLLKMTKKTMIMMRMVLTMIVVMTIIKVTMMTVKLMMIVWVVLVRLMMMVLMMMVVV